VYIFEAIAAVVAAGIDFKKLLRAFFPLISIRPEANAVVEQSMNELLKLF